MQSKQLKINLHGADIRTAVTPRVFITLLIVFVLEINDKIIHAWKVTINLYCY